MEDLRILEAVIAALLAVYLLRSYVRIFRGVDGLFALPAIAFLLTAGTVPAFGFRPELLPLGFFVLFVFLSSLPRLLDIARRLRVDDYGERRPLAAVFGMALLALTFAAAVAFVPASRNNVEPPAAVAAVVDRDRGIEVVLTLRSGRGGSSPRPVVIFGPPVLGSANICDDYVAGLVSRGYSVVTYVRPGLDVPSFDESGRLRFPRFSAVVDSLSSSLFGDGLAFAAEAGARLEGERLSDLRFVVDEVRRRILAGDGWFSDQDVSRITAAGFGIGGAAALLYAAEADPRKIRSVIALEAPVHSYLEAASPPEQAGSNDAEESGGIQSRILSAAGKAKATFAVRAVKGIARRADAAIAPRVPTMMLASDWIREIPRRDRRYGTLVRVLRASSVPCVIVSASGAGPLDFTDVPIDYPVFSFFARGSDKFIPFRTSFASHAAALSASFSRDFLPGTDAGPGIVIEKN